MSIIQVFLNLFAVIQALLFRTIEFLLSFTGLKAQVPGTNYVVITGCDSGFGKELALRLASKGTIVFANCYSNTGAEQLKRESLYKKNIITLVFDVTDHAQCLAAADKVKSVVGDVGVYGLVNNAGIADGYLSDITSIETYRKVMDVNYFGTVNMCIAFLPLVKKAGANLKHGSRIVNMTSVAGRGVSPGVGAYCASKYAGEGYSDSLRVEMGCWNIKVSIIEPFFHDTDIVKKGKVGIDQTMGPEAMKIYGKEFFENENARFDLIQYVTYPRVNVVNAYEKAMFDAFPKQRYIVGVYGKLMAYSYQIVPSFIMDAVFARTYKPPTATLY